jgi:hypothetical protein
MGSNQVHPDILVPDYVRRALAKAIANGAPETW